MNNRYLCLFSILLVTFLTSICIDVQHSYASTQKGGLRQKYADQTSEQNDSARESSGKNPFENWTRDELKAAFDKVAQNFGAFQYAYYTFTLEHQRPPKSIEEFVASGHIIARIIDPYTGEEAFFGERGQDRERAGGLFYAKLDEQWAEFETWYVHPNDSSRLRSLHTKIKEYNHEAEREEIFESDLLREEQLVIIYLLQLDDAIESFDQKLGRLPESLDEMRKLGDVNVDYVNPFTGQIVIHSDELSPGDYMYRKFHKDGTVLRRVLNDKGEWENIDVPTKLEFYEILGWGKKKPVYYFSNDESIEEFIWDDQD